MQPPIKNKVEMTANPPVKEISVRDVDYIIESSKTKILYLIFPRYSEKLWLDFWNHPQIVEQFLKLNKPYLKERNTGHSDPNKFKEIYKYEYGMSKHIVVDYIRKGVIIPITQSTLSSEDVNEAVVHYIDIGENNLEIIRMTDESIATDLESLLFGENYGI